MNLTFSQTDLCPSECSCLGDYVDCSRKRLSEVPKDLPSWVTDLVLQSNSISRLHADDFKGLFKLQKIDLSNNEITTIDENTFANLPALKELKINSNKLKEIPILKGNPILNRLELTHNYIQSINSTAIADLRQLDLLDLAYNDIMDIYVGTFPANLTLTKLFLRNNKIYLLEEGCFDNLTSLESLKLNKNRISKLQKDLFTKMTSLKTLDLSKNHLNVLEGLSFKGLTSLQVLRLRRNAIRLLSAGVFFGLDSLQTLHLDENNLTAITSNWLYGLKTLQTLTLSHNKISKIDSRGWGYAKDVEKLDLSYNDMGTIAADAFTNLNKLNSLDLSNNHVEIIQDNAFKDVSSLEILDLHNNHISWTIEDMKGAFLGLTSLRELNLINNRIKTITKQAFMGLSQLEKLQLQNNNITTIHGNTFDETPELRHLMFNTSSLFCDCSLSWLPMWLRENNFEHDVIAKCAHPEVLKGRSIFTIDSSDFKCEGHFPKPVIAVHPKTQVILLKGDNVTLNCSAASTETRGSKASFQWKKDNVLLEGDNVESYARHQGNLTHYTSRLYLINAKDSDAGKYQCIISNEFGSAYSKRSNVNVYVYPVFTKRPENVTAKAGATAQLVCAAEGEPKPIITWQKHGGFDHFPAAQERRMRVIPEDDHFYIVDVKAADEGIYSCIAKNDAGTVSANVTLTVLQTPSFAKPMENKSSRVGTTTVLECLASGSPQPKLTWLKDGKPLAITQRHFFTADDQLLVIVETKTEDAGEYMCEMSNTLGTKKGTSVLTVITNGSGGSGGKNDGGLDDESTTTGIIIIAVVCCVVGTSLVWVIIIYQTRKRQELYSTTPTDETTLPGEIQPNGYVPTDRETAYTKGLQMTIPAYQYQMDMQMKESGYESSSGKFRAARTAAIFPSDVDGDEMNPNYALLRSEDHYLEGSDENSNSSREYPRSETDSVHSDNSVESSQSGQQQTLSTFHPHETNHDRMVIRRRSPNRGSPQTCDQDTENNQCENSVSSQTDDIVVRHGSLRSPSCVTSPNRGNASSYSICSHCGEEKPHRNTDSCRQSSPPSVPPKPAKFRQRQRSKEHSQFDSSQPPGDSEEAGVQALPVYDEDNQLPPPLPLYIDPYPHLQTDYPHPEGIYFQNGRPYVPVYHPALNTPRYPNVSNKRSIREPNHRPQKDVNPHNQRYNGVIGCVHHPVNSVNSAAWHRHAYTLPYVHNHQFHPIQTLPQQQEQITPQQRDQVSPRQREVQQTTRTRHDGKSSQAASDSETKRLLNETTQTFEV